MKLDAAYKALRRSKAVPRLYLHWYYPWDDRPVLHAEVTLRYAAFYRITDEYDPIWLHCELIRGADTLWAASLLPKFADATLEAALELCTRHALAHGLIIGPLSHVEGG